MGSGGCARTGPPLVVWGRSDPFFPEPGAHAYRRDLPDAEVHVFDTGHFSVKGDDRLAPRAVEALLQALPAAGAAALEYTPGRRFRATARDQAEALDIFRTADSAVRWSYASPPPKDLVPGERTGGYLAQARDTPITDEQGRSRVTIGDFASAVVDAWERDQFVGERFTVAYERDGTGGEGPTA